jgi:hypothetical protein
LVREESEEVLILNSAKLVFNHWNPDEEEEDEQKQDLFKPVDLQNSCDVSKIDYD